MSKPGILRLTAPLVVSFVLRAAFAWVDAAFAADLDRRTGGGDSSIAAIGLTLPFEFMIIACWVGTSNGLTARLGAAIGAREGERIEQLKHAVKKITRWLCLVFLLVAASVWLHADRIAPNAQVTGQFRIYATVLLAGSAITSFWSILPDSLVKAHHDTRSTMWAGVISGSLNVVLNTIFMYVFGWGIFGIALSTVLGRLGGLAFALGRAAHHERLREERGRDTAKGTYARPVWAILAIGIPASITFLMMSVESLAVNEILKRTAHPTSALAAWLIFDQSARFLSMPMIACGVAMLPLTARLWGERNIGGIRAELKIAAAWGLVYVGLVVLPLTLLIGPRVAAWLSDTEETRVFAEVGMRLLPLTVICMSPLFVLRSVFDGMQRPRPGLVVSLVRTIVLVVPLTLLGVSHAGGLGIEQATGAYLGFTCGVGLASIALGLLVVRALHPTRLTERGA